MKVSQKKLSLVRTSCLTAGLFFSSLALALPSQITFSNETSLSLGTSIAGLPGQGVAPNATKSANYALVSMGCLYGNVIHNCGIEFTDRSNGAPVATVYINAETATLTRPPLFHGAYGEEYDVTGWQTSPIEHIHIVKKNKSVNVA